MADVVVDRLSVGATVAGSDIFKETFEGQVLAFDVDFKIVIIRSTKVGRSGTFDIRFINLEHADKFEVVKEGCGPPKHLPNINYDKVIERTKKNTEEKLRAVKYIGNGVTDTAQNLMNFISRIFSECRWDGNDIYIMDQVVINPPYKQQNCQPVGQNCRILDFVTQLIEKFFRETKAS